MSGERCALHDTIWPEMSKKIEHLDRGLEEVKQIQYNRSALFTGLDERARAIDARISLIEQSDEHDQLWDSINKVKEVLVELKTTASKMIGVGIATTLLTPVITALIVALLTKGAK